MESYLPYAIGSSSTALIKLSDLRVAMPDNVIHYPYEKDEQLGDGTWQGYGFEAFHWVWDILSRYEMDIINHVLFTSATQVSNTAYITTDKRDGWYPNAEIAFADYQVIAKRPFLTGQEGTPVVRTAKAYSSVTYIFVVVAEV